MGYSQKHAHVNMFLRWGCAVRHNRPAEIDVFCNIFSARNIAISGLASNASELDIPASSGRPDVAHLVSVMHV